MGVGWFEGQKGQGRGLWGNGRPPMGGLAHAWCLQDHNFDGFALVWVPCGQGMPCFSLLSLAWGS